MQEVRQRIKVTQRKAYRVLIPVLIPILVLVLKEFVGTRLDWAVFYNQLAGYVGIFCCATFVASFVYLRQRYRKETALCGCEEIATLEPTENNVLTIA